MHSNAVNYNPELDQIVLTIRNLSEVWIIDHSTTTAEAASHSGGNSGMGGDLLYRWGNPQGYDRGTSADRKLFGPHHGHWIEPNLPGGDDILIFNNGTGRPGGNYLSVDQITTPVQPDGSYYLAGGSAYGPANANWIYTDSPPSAFYAASMSGAHRLPNGNTLVCDGPAGDFFEVTTDKDVVWEYDAGVSVFRATRHSPDYPGLAIIVDNTPPSPDPMTWASLPEATGSRTIIMTATTATDDSEPVEYYFECTNYGDANSNWQTSPTYEATGLNPDTEYTFRLKARDSSDIQNETAWSTEQSATTEPPDTTPPSPDPMTWASLPTATGSTTITMTATAATDDTLPVEYYFECITDSDANSTWQTNPTYVATDLTPLTSYTFRVKARDSAAAQNETGWSTEESDTTEPPGTDVEIIGSWVENLSHAKESGTNCALIFIAHWEDNIAPSLTVTYGGQTMTKVIDVTAGASNFRNYLAAFILDESGIAAASGSTFVPTWGDTPSSVSYASVFLQNVDQTSIIGATDSASTTSSTPNPITTDSLYTEDGDVVIVGAVCGNNGSYTLNNGFTEGTDQSVGSNGHTGVTGHKSATGVAETPSATFDDTVNRQAIIGFVIQASAGGTPPGQATNPNPSDLATGVDINADLSWTAGTGATSHDVYFGTTSPGYFQGNQTETTFEPGTMANYTTYYWRIDEKDASSTTTGNVWSFTTEGVAPSITTTEITTAIVNQAYTYDVDAAGIPAPTYSLSASPSGMTINAVSGVIDWTPDEGQLGLNAVTVTAANGQEPNDTQSFDIDVAGVAPSITSAEITTAIVNQAYTYDVDAAGIPAPAYSLTIAPSGMTINAVSGVIDWMPDETQLGLNAVTVTAANGQEPNDTQSFDIDVAGVAPSITSAEITTAIVNQAYTYDVDAAGIPAPAYSLSAAPSGMTINAVSGVIDWMPDETQLGLNAVTVTAINGQEPNDTQSFDIDVAGVAPTITSAEITTATVNQAYTYDVDAAGIPAPAYSLSASPSGMTINAVSGVIDWTPNEGQLGLNAVTVTAINGQEPNDTQSFDIDVAGVAPSITSTAVTTATVNQAYTYDVDAAGIPAPTYSLSIAPSGMTINAVSGVIDWTPDETQLGLNAVTVTAANGQEPNDTQSFDIDVAGVAPTITSAAVTTATVNQAYTYDVDAAGIPAPTYSLSASPSGMTINAVSGVIDWTPDEGQLGLNAVTVTAINGQEPNDTQSFDIDVAGVAPSITSAEITTAIVNQAYTYDVDAAGIPAPTYSLTTSPSGMTINAVSGVIDWTPNETQLGLNAVTVTAINGQEPNDTQSFDINVEIILSDDFNDNRRGSMWRLVGDWSENLYMVEQEEQLQVLADGQGGDLAVWYSANGWILDPNQDFACQVDFHYSELADQNGWIGINVESEGMYVTIAAGSDSNGLYFYYEAEVDSNIVVEQEIRDFNDGTLYITYDADTNSIYLSHEGSDSEDAYVWKSIPNPLTFEWDSDVVVSIGCGGDNFATADGRVYLDNFEVMTAVLFGWPPATDLDGNGYIELYDLEIMCGNWLGTGAGDIDNSGNVDFLDFAEFGLAW